MYAFSLTQSTYRRKPRNAVTQYSARTLEEKSKDDIKRATTDIISFIEKVTPRYAKSQPIMSQYISLSLYFVCQCCLHQLIHVTLNVLLCSCWAFWVLFEYCPCSFMIIICSDLIKILNYQSYTHGKKNMYLAAIL